MVSLQQIQTEYIKSYTDKTRKYFIENFLSTFDADRRKSVPFKLFPRQIEFLKSIVKYPNSIAIKHRQAGITTVSSAWVTAQIVFASKDAPETVLCIGNKLDISQQLVTKIGDFLDQVPRYFWGDEFYSPDPKSEKNKKSIYEIRNKSELQLFNGCKVVARSSGENAARGISAVSILIFDEAAFIENGLSVYAQAVAATASVRDAKIIMVSTPNGKDQLYYRTYSKALEKKNNYNAVEFKWFQDLRYNRNLKWYKKDKETGEFEWIKEETIDAEGNIRYNEERWRELEKNGWIPTSPWYENMCQSFNGDEMKIAQELNVSFLGSSDNVIAPEVIEFQLNNNVVYLPDDWNLKDPFVEETWIWKDPIPGHRYICAVDASRGDAADKTAIEIIDIDAKDENGNPYFDQVLEYNGKRTGDEIGEIVFNYATAYNNALVVIDCVGGTGDAAVLTLMRLKYPNLYYDDPSLKTYMIQRKYSEYNLKDTDRLPGFHQSSVRYQMLSNFVTMVKNNSFRVRSIRVINEMETWIFKGEARRIDHMDGCHDDTLTCIAMALFVLQFSFFKMEDTKKKNAVILKSWVVNNNINSIKRPTIDNKSVSIAPDRILPFYNKKTLDQKSNKVSGTYMWLIGSIKR